DGTATVTYPDKTTDTIQGSDLVRPATDAEKTTPKVPSTKEPVANTSHLTDGEKAKVQKNVEDANKDENGKSTLPDGTTVRSEEHTSELQSRFDLVCRLLLEKKKADEWSG